MAEKRRFLDIWLTEPNTVYREVPYTVVADWVQQSRIQPDDKLRPSGTAEWFRVGDSPEFRPYIPTVEAVSVEDEASAREDIALDFRWKKHPDDGDDDVDMIPLIDVSLVLLVFFMLTSTVADAGSMIQDIPKTKNGLVIGREGMIYVNVRPMPKSDEGVEFSVSIGPGSAIPFRTDEDSIQRKEQFPRTPGEVVEQVRTVFEANKGKLTQLTIRADEKVASGVVRDLTVKLTEAFGKRISQTFYGVGEEEQQP